MVVHKYVFIHLSDEKDHSPVADVAGITSSKMSNLITWGNMDLYSQTFPFKVVNE